MHTIFVHMVTQVVYTCLYLVLPRKILATAYDSVADRMTQIVGR